MRAYPLKPEANSQNLFGLQVVCQDVSANPAVTTRSVENEKIKSKSFVSLATNIRPNERGSQAQCVDVVKAEGVDVAAADFVKRGILIASNLQLHKNMKIVSMNTYSTGLNRGLPKSM